ncbi:MAG TPA: hypothetical protein VIX86_27070 [Streptosporangiaceae bacterium]
MLVILTVATVAGWLCLFAALVVARWMAWTRRAGGPPGNSRRPASADEEPPAVVSLLAGRLEAYGYPATLLDLAARGWLRLEAAAGGPVSCVIAADPPDEELTDYEQRVYAQVVSRAGSRRDVPARALSDGFAGPATLGASGRDMKSARDSFMAAFHDEVKADSRARGLIRKRLTEPAGCLLWVAALIPAAAAGLVVRAHHSHAYWIPVVGLVVLWVVSGIAVSGERLTPAGRAALDRWRARCSGSGAGGVLPAAGWTPPGATGPVTSDMTTAVLPPGWPGRQVAYAAALGRARPAVKLFSGPAGVPPAKQTWSSYGGQWRQVTIGSPLQRDLPDGGGILLWLGLGLLPATIAVAVVGGPWVRAGALLVMVGDALLLAYAVAKDQRLSRFTEFDGRVIEAWVETIAGENADSYVPCLALDDGQRDEAWALSVSREQYERFTPGTLVHARVNPRRNRLLGITPIETDVGDTRAG